MPTDGADFKTNRACFGKAYAFARDGAEASLVANAIGSGIERLIKLRGGAPAFGPIIDTLVTASLKGESTQSLLGRLDKICSKFADSPLTRDLGAAASMVAVNAELLSGCISRQQAAEALLLHLGYSHCDGMLPYIVRNRTISLAAGQNDVSCYKECLREAPELRDLATRMLHASDKGLPAKALPPPRIIYTAEGLNEEIT